MKSLSSALILIHPSPLAILFFVQYDYHQLQKICSWSASFGYIEYFFTRYILWVTTHQTKYFAATYSVTKKNSVTQVNIYCKFTQEKEYGYLNIHNSYLWFLCLLNVHHKKTKIIFSTQEQTTERKFNSMIELAKEFKAQYSLSQLFTHYNKTGWHTFNNLWKLRIK